MNRKFKKLISEGAKELPVTSPGTQRRNFTHVDDITDGILLVAGKGAGDGYGIGANESHSILDVCKAFGGDPKLQRASPANRMNGELRTDQIKSLGWEPKHSLIPYITSFLKKIGEK